MNLAECEEHLNKLASARQHIQRAIDLATAQNDDRVDIARQKFAAIDKRVPRLTITLATTTIPGTIVKRDGVELGAGSLATPLPVEPGNHTVTVSAPGRETKKFDIALAESEQKSLAVDVGPEGASSDQPPASGDATQPEYKSSGLRTAGFIVGGVGLAALATGTIFALVAIDKNSSSDAGCEGNLCDDKGFEDRASARDAGNLATVFFIGGGVALAAGAAMVLLSPSSSDRRAARFSPLISSTGGGVLVGRSF